MVLVRHATVRAITGRSVRGALGLYESWLFSSFDFFLLLFLAPDGLTDGFAGTFFGFCFFGFDDACVVSAPPEDFCCALRAAFLAAFSAFLASFFLELAEFGSESYRRVRNNKHRVSQG